MKIICVGQNYPEHIRELGMEVPVEPVLFLKPDTALLPKGQPFFIPEFSTDLQHEAEVIFRICRVGKNIPRKFARKYYDAISLGIDFTARDLQRSLRAKGLPWEICKGFDGSAVIGQWFDVADFADADHIGFSLRKNGQTVQRGNTSDMLFKIDEIIEYASRFFTLKIGDIIYTGTPVGVSALKGGDILEGEVDRREAFTVRVK